MSRVIEMSGLRFGRLQVLREGKSNKNGLHWLCLCDCGKTKEILGVHLRSGSSKTCGCSRAEALLKHGRARIGQNDSTYTCWANMIQRCTNPNSAHFDRYGGRGITVCKRWRHSFSNFLSDMGPKPIGLSIDRIDNDGNYKPSNCRWATKAQQSSNRNIDHSKYSKGIKAGWVRRKQIIKSCPKKLGAKCCYTKCSCYKEGGDLFEAIIRGK